MFSYCHSIGLCMASKKESQYLFKNGDHIFAFPSYIPPHLFSLYLVAFSLPLFSSTRLVFSTVYLFSCFLHFFLSFSPFRHQRHGKIVENRPLVVLEEERSIGINNGFPSCSVSRQRGEANSLFRRGGIYPCTCVFVPLFSSSFLVLSSQFRDELYPEFLKWAHVPK